ncbi:hypothetical protein LINPERHAP2_LOCUS3510 [Linum perenne]
MRGPEESRPNDQPPWIPVGENDIVASISKGVKSLTLSKEFKDKLCKPWSRSFVIRLLGKSIGYSFLCQRLHAMWKPVGHLHIVDLDRSCFLVKFGNDQDYFKALTGGLGSFWTSTLSFINGTNLSGCLTSSQTSWLRGFGFLTSLFNSTTLKSWHLWATPLSGHAKEVCPLATRHEVTPVKETINSEVKDSPPAAMTPETFGPWMIATRRKRKPFLESNSKMESAKLEAQRSPRKKKERRIWWVIPRSRLIPKMEIRIVQLILKRDKGWLPLALRLV